MRIRRSQARGRGGSGGAAVEGGQKPPGLLAGHAVGLQACHALQGGDGGLGLGVVAAGEGHRRQGGVALVQRVQQRLEQGDVLGVLVVADRRVGAEVDQQRRGGVLPDPGGSPGRRTR